MPLSGHSRRRRGLSLPTQLARLSSNLTFGRGCGIIFTCLLFTAAFRSLQFLALGGASMCLLYLTIEASVLVPTPPSELFTQA